jgi:hypothetical protein
VGKYRGQRADKVDEEWIQGLKFMLDMSDEDVEGFYGLPRSDVI